MKTDNTAIITSLASAYKRLQAADKFVVGFNIEGNIYFAEISLDSLLNDFAGISMTSDETPCKRLRIKPLNKKTAILFNSYNPQLLCSFDELQELAKAEFSANCGQAFESMICNYYNGKLNDYSIPFWKAGDFSANGLQYQAKFQMATIITEYTMQKAIEESYS